MNECVKVFCVLTGYDENKIKPAPTPLTDESKENSGVAGEVEGKVGELPSISAKCLMKVMYMARLARGDLLRAVGHLSTKITNWIKDSDVRLFPKDSARSDLSVTNSRTSSFVYIQMRTLPATGVFLALTGTHSFWPLCGQSKRQTAVSHSTVEAELVACYHGLRSEGLPALLLWEPILGRKTSLVLYQVNQATMRIIQTGKAPTLRHIRRVHQVSMRSVVA